MDLTGGSWLSARENKMKGKGEGGKRVAGLPDLLSEPM
jgi:hypothetical protein